MDSITGILCQVTSAVSASLGNYFVKEDAKRGYDIFCNIEFLNFWLYGFSMIALMSLMSPFITIWLGTEYTLGKWVAIALAIRFFVEGYMNTLSVFRSTLGLFAYGQILPLVATVINIILSIGLGYVWGIAGVLIATPISRLAVQAWYNPWLIHNRGFHKSVIPFYKRYLLRVLLLGAAAMVTMVCTQFIFKSGINLFSFILAAITVCLIPNLIFLVFFSRSKEFSYFIDLIYTKFIQKQVHNN